MRNVKREISILKRLCHPFIIKLPYAIEDKSQVKFKKKKIIYIYLKKIISKFSFSYFYLNIYNKTLIQDHFSNGVYRKNVFT